jgi:hypothetical protein
MTGALQSPHLPTALATGLRRLPAARRRRGLLALALAAAAPIAGGSLGVLLAVAAVLVGVDALLPAPDTTVSQADDAFRRAVRGRRLAATARRLRGRPPARLEVLDDREGWAPVAERRALGIQPIRLDSITGTVEELKARTFDDRLRPDRAARERWRAAWLAQARGADLPPIAVYRVGGRHVLLDGHHRASAARARGWTWIDAEVVELRPAMDGARIASPEAGAPAPALRAGRLAAC